MDRREHLPRPHPRREQGAQDRAAAWARDPDEVGGADAEAPGVVGVDLEERLGEVLAEARR